MTPKGVSKAAAQCPEGEQEQSPVQKLSIWCSLENPWQGSWGGVGALGSGGLGGGDGGKRGTAGWRTESVKSLQISAAWTRYDISVLPICTPENGVFKAPYWEKVKHLPSFPNTQLSWHTQLNAHAPTSRRVCMHQGSMCVHVCVRLLWPHRWAQIPRPHPRYVRAHTSVQVWVCAHMHTHTEKST